MKIVVATGRGVGATKLSAFDAALWDAGIGDYNLIYLSSVIPAGAEVVEETYRAAAGSVGWRLYCVMSAGYRTHDEADDSWVGLGWASRPDRGGIFIEEAAASRGEVAGKIQQAHADMSRRRGDVGALKTAIVQVPAPDRYSCAVVAAVYKLLPWREYPL